MDYREFLEKTPLVPWRADARSWNMTYVGPQAVDLLGFPIEDWYEPSFWSDHIYVDDRSATISTCSRLAAEGGSFEFDYRMVRADGAIIWVHDIVAVEMGDTGPVSLSGFLIDITGRKALETALSDRENMLWQMGNALPALIAFVDTEERYRYVNDTYARWFDVDPANIEGLAVREVLGENLYRRVSPSIKTALRGEPAYFELDLPTLDGSARPVEASLFPQYDGQGVVSGFFVVLLDVSDQARAKEADRLQREALAHVSRVAAIGELTASIAHELNQPLSAIVANAQAASRFLAGPTPDLGEIDEALSDIAGDAKRAGDVIRHMRDFLKSGERQKDTLDVNALVAETVQMLQSDAIARNVSVALESGADVPNLSGDSVQLQQVILNLMMNAFDAVSEGPGDPGSVVIRTSASNGCVEISFSDNGPGFRDDIAKDPFGPFVSSKPDGLGLGLSISRTIAEAHGGQLLAENNPGGGASLRVILPVSFVEGE